MNNITKGKKCTILWHVENLKMLHVDTDVAYRVLIDIDVKYGKIEK